MAKRMTDTDKWKKPFIKGLDTPCKLLWVYLLDECNHAGIWQVEFEIAELRIGEKYNPDEVLKLFNDHIVVFSNGEKWFIPDFINFQYGKLNEKNKPHNSVIQVLKKYNLLKKDMLLESPLEGAKDKEQDKVIDIVKDKEKFVADAITLKTPNNADHIRTFIGHWTELTTDGKAMRFQLERTWETRKRLQKWIQNSR